MNKYWNITLFLTLIVGNNVLSQSLLPPPFGLKWGESPQNILNWGEENNLEILITSPPHSRETEQIRIQAKRGNLPNHQAKSLESRFFRGQLYEAALSYHSPKDANVGTMENSFQNLKKEFESLYGKLKKNREEKDVKNDFERKSLGYFAEPVPGLILFMTYTEMTDRLRNQGSARFTIIYHNDNLAPVAEKVRKPKPSQAKKTPQASPSP